MRWFQMRVPSSPWTADKHYKEVMPDAHRDPRGRCPVDRLRRGPVLDRLISWRPRSGGPGPLSEDDLELSGRLWP